MSPNPTPRLQDYLLLAFLYFGVTELASIQSMPDGTLIYSLQTTVLLAFLVIFNARGYLLWLILPLCASLLSAWPQPRFTDALLNLLTNAFAASLAYTLLSSLNFDRRMNSIAELLKFTLAGPVLAGLTAAFVDSTFRAEILGQAIEYPEHIRSIWFANAVGLMLFAPLLWAFWQPALSDLHFKPKSLRADYLVAVIACLLALLYLNAENGRIAGLHIGPILLLPVILYTAVRRDIRYTSSVVGVLCLLTAYLTVTGRNPMAVVTITDMIIAAQQFLIITSLLALGVSALMEQIRYRQFSLEQVNKELSHDKHTLESKIEKEESQLETAEDKLEQMALTDQMTQLLNWRGFLDLALQELNRSFRHRQPVSLLSIDVDHFKKVNEQYGHQGGDEILAQIGDVIREVVRNCDIAARFGGEEFIVLAPNTNLAQGQLFAERLRSAIAETKFTCADHSVRLTTSIGLAERQDDEHFDRLSCRADACRAQAKRRGRNCVVNDQDIEVGRGEGVNRAGTSTAQPR